MSKRKAYNLPLSSMILQYPNDDVDMGVLTGLLEDARDLKLPRSTRVTVTRHERLVKSDPKQGYADRRYAIPLGELFCLYESVTGTKFSSSGRISMGKDI